MQFAIHWSLSRMCDCLKVERRPYGTPRIVLLHSALRYRTLTCRFAAELRLIRKVLPRTPVGIENRFARLGNGNHLRIPPRRRIAPCQLSMERWHCWQLVEYPIA